MRNFSPEYEFKILNSLYNSKYGKKSIFSSEVLGSITDFIKIIKKNTRDAKIREYLKYLKNEGILIYKEIRNINGIDTSFFIIDRKKLIKKMEENLFWKEIQKFIGDEFVIFSKE